MGTKSRESISGAGGIPREALNAMKP